MKEGTNNTTLDSILFTYSRGAGKYLFHCSRPKDMQVMDVCLCHAKAIVRDKIFLHKFRLCMQWQKVIQGHTCLVIDSPIHDKHDGASFNFVCHSVGKLQPF